VKAPSLNTKREIFLYPVLRTDSQDQLFVSEVGGVSTFVNLPAGTYYAHRDSTLGFQGYPSLFLALESAMNAALTGTYTISAATPTESSAWENLGIQITATGVTSFSITDFADEQPLPSIAQLLGCPQDTAVNSVGTVWTSPRTRAGKWVSNMERTEALGFPESVIRFSTGRTERQDAYAVDYGERLTRRFVYEFESAAVVFEQRATRQSYAAASALATGDVHNAFESLWRRMRRLDEIIVVYFEEGEPFDLEVDTHGHEVVKLDSEEVAQAFASVAALRLRGPETHTLTLPTVVVGASNYVF